MTELYVTYKTIRLPLAAVPDRFPLTPEERAARVQAHMDRVHPVVDALREQEARQRELGPITRQRKSDRKWRIRDIEKARMRARAIAAMNGAIQ